MGSKLRPHSLASFYSPSLTLVQELSRILGESFQLVTAFSRQGPKKVYVQDRLLEMAAEINHFLDLGAHVYVCGDAAHMARGVRSTLATIIADQRNVPFSEADAIAKSLKASGKYQVSQIVCHDFSMLTSFCRKMFGRFLEVVKSLEFVVDE